MEKRAKAGVRITFRSGGAEPMKVPVAHGPVDGEDLKSFVERIARHAGIAWDEATVQFCDGTRQEVSRR